MYYKKRSKKFNEKIEDFIKEYNNKMGLVSSNYALTTDYVNGLLDLLGEAMDDDLKKATSVGNVGNPSASLMTAFKNFSKTLLDKTTNELLNFSNELGSDFGEKIDKYANYLKVFNDLINKIGSGYVAEHGLSPTSIDSFGGILYKEIEEKVSTIYKKDTTLASMVEKLDTARQDVLNYRSDLINGAVNNYESSSKHVDNSDEAERATNAIKNMAVAYTTLREEYHKKTFIQKWLTSAGWRESNIINKTRKEMMNVMHIKNAKRFNELAKTFCNKKSDSSYNFNENVFETMKDEFKKNRFNYVEAFRKEFKILKDDDGVIDIPNELVNEGTQNIIIEEKADSKENPELITIKEN